MLETLRQLFTGDNKVTIVTHDFADELSTMGRFDAVISSLGLPLEVA